MRTLLAAALLAGAVPAAAAAPASSLPWIRDDLVRALAVAKARQVPVVVDVWAPW